MNGLEIILPTKGAKMDETVERIFSWPAAQKSSPELLFIYNILHCININGPRVLEPSLLNQIQEPQALPW